MFFCFKVAAICILSDHMYTHLLAFWGLDEFPRPIIASRKNGYISCTRKAL